MVMGEFDPLGFSVKDLQTGSPLMRYESTGDLYPLIVKSRSNSPSTFLAASPNLWHSRLGHSGPTILSSLRNHDLISCNKTRSFCTSCPLGKHVRLPFCDSLTTTTMPFDIVHSDLCTSPVLSSIGHRYYVFFLDDYSNYLWTFPIANKSQVFAIFQSFKTMIRTQFERDIRKIQCDNGRDFDNGPFHSFCK